MAKYKFIVYGALFLALLSATQAFSQEDFFPPEGIWIPPCCSTGGTGSTGPTYGRNGQSGWKQIWGAMPGDIVTIQYILRATSAGSLHSYPKTTGGSDLQYLGDQNNPYQRWNWNTFGRRDKGGEFCLDCPFQFTANWPNPWVYVEYWDSGGGWDVDLNVVNISTPPPPPSSSSWFQVLTQFDKDAAKAISRSLNTSAWVFQGVALRFASIDKRAAMGLGVLGWGVGAISNLFDKVDPWDGDYCSVTPLVRNEQVAADLAWVYEFDDLTGGYLPASIQSVTDLMNQAEVATNRAMSAASVGAWDCAWARKGEAINAYNQAGNWLEVFHWVAAVYTDNGYDMSELGEGISNLWSATLFLWEVQ